MKCPLMLTYDVSEAPCEHPNPMECLQSDCAWWAPLDDACAVRDLPGIMLLIGNVLGKIYDNMSLARATFTCRDCGLRVELAPGNDYEKPRDWQRFEQVDGKCIWLCDQCSTLTGLRR